MHSKLVSSIKENIVKSLIYTFIIGLVIGVIITLRYHYNLVIFDWKFSLAIGTTFFTLYRYYKETKEKKSRFYLEKYIEASKMILDFIETDTPTRRIAWVSAEKVAKKISTLKEKITEEPDKVFYKIYLRSFTHTLLNYLRKQSGYFYGLDSNISKDNLSMENTENACEICGYDNTPVLTHSLTPKWREPKHIDEKSIKCIIDLIAPILLEENNIAYNNDDDFLTIIKFNWGELYKFIMHMRVHNRI